MLPVFSIKTANQFFASASFHALHGSECEYKCIIFSEKQNYKHVECIDTSTLNIHLLVLKQQRFEKFSFFSDHPVHTGKLPQQHEFANASFVILIRCHFVSPYHVDGSANNVLCRGGHFCEVAGVPAHLISSQVQLEQENSLNSLKRYPKTAWPKGPRHFERKE